MMCLCCCIGNSFAQPDPAAIYSLQTRLGINGSIKVITAYKYAEVQYTAGNEDQAKGKLYSVIRNYYDMLGRIARDSTALFYNAKTAVGYCKTYTYGREDSTDVIYITTRFDCVPPDISNATEQTVIELVQQNDSVTLAKEYAGNTLTDKRKTLITSFRFIVKNGLLQRTVFSNYGNRRREGGTGSYTYQYDDYGNFTHTIIEYGSGYVNTQHKISVIDDHGNALRMLNFSNGNKEPEFMTTYEIEYY